MKDAMSWLWIFFLVFANHGRIGRDAMKVVLEKKKKKKVVLGRIKLIKSMCSVWDEGLCWY